MTGADTHPSTTKTVITPENTLALLSDPDSSDFLMDETLSNFIKNHEIAHAIIDISTPAGRFAALHLYTENFSYSIFDTALPDDLDTRTKIRQDLAVDNAISVEPFDLALLAELQAEILLLPAALGPVPAIFSNDPQLNLSIGTTTGAAVNQLQLANRPYWLLMPPESGLRGLQGGSYVRNILAVRQ